ncbi:hypothetical protein [Baekduia alba]|uniref:hypothetical protein n=1 Tax=Baekduia alba TaxID=2997333 RepID=UPI0023427FB2|nr:hypothetical protein [Baekduia alba]
MSENAEIEGLRAIAGPVDIHTPGWSEEDTAPLSYGIAVSFLDGDMVMVQAKEAGYDLGELLAGARAAIEQHREKFTS